MHKLGLSLYRRQIQVKKQLNQEHLIGVICLILGGITLFLTSSFPKGQSNINITGPAFFPNVLAIIFLLCGIYEIILGFFQEKGRIDVNLHHLWLGLKSPQVLNVILIIFLLVFFIAFFERLGFILSTFVVLFILLFRLGVPVGKNLIYTVTFIVIILVIFGRLFSISLPSGVLESFGL
jgi:hypothetical protein